MFVFITDYWREHTEVPTVKAVRHDFPDWRPVKPEEPFTYYIAEMAKARAYAVLSLGVREATERLKEGDPDGAKVALTANLTKVNTEVSVLRDIEFNSTLSEWTKQYREGQPGLLGAPTAFDSLDRATGGWQKEQLITVVGPPKAGKSTLALYMALAANAFGWRPLFVSMEMSVDEQRMRAVAMKAKVDFQRLLQYRLNRQEMQRVEAAVRAQENLPDFIVSADAAGASTLSQLTAKVQQYQPHMLIVDGVYLMQNEEGHPEGSAQALTTITRGMKRLAQQFEIPVLETTQVLEWKYSQRRGITSNSVGYTSSFIQDSDAIIGVEWDVDDNPSRRRLSIVRARNAVQKSWLLDWDWTTSTFTELTDIDEDESDDVY